MRKALTALLGSLVICPPVRWVRSYNQLIEKHTEADQALFQELVQIEQPG